MRCFTGGSSGRSRTPVPTPPTTPTDGGNHNHNHSPSAASSTQTSAPTSPNLTINIRQHYIESLRTPSYKEIWSKIHHTETAHSELVDSVLQPDRSSIREVLDSARFTPLTRLVSQYLDSSEHTTHLFLSLKSSVDRARSIYAPIADLLELLPIAEEHNSNSQLSQSQCDCAFGTFQEFDTMGNPFPAPTAVEAAGGGETACSFDGIRCCFLELKQQLDSRLVDAQVRQRVLRCTTRSSAYCLLASAVAAAATGLVIATHALVALVAAGPTTLCCGDPLARQRRQLREHVAQVDSAARETYALNNHLDTIERLVARLYVTVESDKVLVRLVLERGRGKGRRHQIQEVVRHLRKNHSSFMRQLSDLDKHIVLCLAAVNRARSVLIQQIHC